MTEGNERDGNLFDADLRLSRERAKSKDKTI
jgi:hypothetical protein